MVVASRMRTACCCDGLANASPDGGLNCWPCPLCIHRETRAAGTAINTFTNLIMTFVVGQTFLSMLCSMKFGVSDATSTEW
jgi:hypothetical protein